MTAQFAILLSVAVAIIVFIGCTAIIVAVLRWINKGGAHHVGPHPSEGTEVGSFPARGAPGFCQPRGSAAWASTRTSAAGPQGVDRCLIP